MTEHCCGSLDFSERLENRDPHFKEIKLTSVRYILRPKCDYSS